MEVRPINCRWPHCADYDESCQTGISIPCIVIEGENLERERLAADRPFFATPRESLLMVAVILIAIGAALWAANAAAGMPV